MFPFTKEPSNYRQREYRERRDISPIVFGDPGCSGALAIIHKPVGNPSSIGYIRKFRPGTYRNTWRVFRRSCIVMVEVWGTCSWRLYPQSRFRGRYQTLTPGFSSQINFIPRSIAQI